MKYVYLASNWAFGSLFLLLGIICLFDDPWPALPLFAISILLLPPVRKFAHSKLGKQLPFKARLVSVFVLLILFAFLIGQSQQRKQQELVAQKAKEQAEQLAKIRQQNIDYFNENRKKILSKVRNAIAGKDYEKALSLASKYLPTNDSELSSLHSEAKTTLAEITKKAKADKILSELRKIPAKEYEKNRSLYKELVNLYPSNKKYSERYEYYSKKVQEEKEKQRLAAERKKRIESQFSAWDGSHRNLERVVKKAMNDPESYKHVETVYWDMGSYLIVRTTFRGKNVFGGVVKNSVKAKVDLDGNVLEILEQY